MDPTPAAPTPIDAATGAMVRYLGCENDPTNPELAEAVDTFMAQLGEVAAVARSTQDFIDAGARLAAAHLGAVGAGWAAYVAGIRGLDLMYQAMTTAVVVEAEEYLHGER